MRKQEMQAECVATFEKRHLPLEDISAWSVHGPTVFKVFAPVAIRNGVVIRPPVSQNAAVAGNKTSKRFVQVCLGAL